MCLTVITVVADAAMAALLFTVNHCFIVENDLWAGIKDLMVTFRMVRIDLLSDG